MYYEEFLTRVIDEGIAAAKKDYSRPDQKYKLEGSIAGFEACRGKKPSEIFQLLTVAQARTSREAMFRRKVKRNYDREDLEEYWKVRCFELEVEWVANVVSAMLMNQGVPTIVPPTARGMMKAAEILGVRKELVH